MLIFSVVIVFAFIRLVVFAAVVVLFLHAVVSGGGEHVWPKKHNYRKLKETMKYDIFCSKNLNFQFYS
jgi:hypothetical protein